MRGPFLRRLLEVLYDGGPRAAGDILGLRGTGGRAARRRAQASDHPGGGRGRRRAGDVLVTLTWGRYDRARGQASVCGRPPGAARSLPPQRRRHGLARHHRPQISVARLGSASAAANLPHNPGRPARLRVRGRRLSGVQFNRRGRGGGLRTQRGSEPRRSPLFSAISAVKLAVDRLNGCEGWSARQRRARRRRPYECTKSNTPSTAHQPYQATKIDLWARP